MMLINITKKFVMVFTIGVLIGAMIVTAGFLVFAKSQKQSSHRSTPPSFSQSENSGMPGMNDGNRQGNFGQSDQSSKSQGNNGNQGELPPQKPDGDNQGNIPQAPDSNSQTTLS